MIDDRLSDTIRFDEQLTLKSLILEIYFSSQQLPLLLHIQIVISLTSHQCHCQFTVTLVTVKELCIFHKMIKTS